jgi:heat shock protein HslJ
MKPMTIATGIVLIAGTFLASTAKLAAAEGGLLTNLEYRTSSTKSGTVKLVNGEYREPAAPGSASETVVKLTDRVAAAVLDGKRAAAAVLVTETGGSGTFSELALIVEQNGALVNVDTVRLGDRIKVNSLAFVKGAVTVDMAIPGPNDPACCPTQKAVRTYTVANGKLVEASGGDTAEQAATLTDVLWEWHETKRSDGTGVTPDDPSKYTLEFLEDGKVEVRFDCNRGFGTYTVSAASLTITLMAGTTAECPPVTWGREYIKELRAAQSFALRDGDLSVTLSSGKGTMKFIRAGKAPK